MKILNAKSDERKTLFQKLFNTMDYESIQYRLKAKNDESSAAFEEVKNAIRAASGRVVISDDFEEHETLTLYISDDKYVAQLIPVLAQCTEYQKAEHGKLQEQVELLKADIKVMEADFIKADSANKDIDSLEKFRTNFVKLQSHDSEIDEMKSVLAAAERAVELEADEMLLAQKKQEIVTDTIRLEDSEADLKELEIRLPEYREQLEAAMKEDEKTDEIKDRIRKLREGAGIVAQLADAEKCGAKAAGQMEVLIADSKSRDYEYTQIKEQYYRSQSGLIAAELADGVPCPVCGSLEHPMPAVLTEDAVTREDVETAETSRKEAERRLALKEKSIAEINAEITAARAERKR